MTELLGHDGFRYKLVKGWGELDPAKVPVNNCHEMVMSKSGLLYMLTDETRNNILVYTKDGELRQTWGTEYPGGHGLTLHDENGEEFLYITDTERHQVIKTTLNGKVVMVLDYPREIHQYSSAEEYKPTETAIADNGDIYVTDGYGHQFIIQYNAKGEYLRHWGGRGTKELNFDCVHGIAIDKRHGEPTLLITSRNDNALRRFTMDGTYINSIYLPGSFICRPVIHGKNIYGAVFRSETNSNFGSGYITILDEHDHVVSTPGGTGPQYTDGKLQPQKKVDNDIFIHPHDVCVDNDENLYIPQWKSNNTYPVKLERV